MKTKALLSTAIGTMMLAGCVNLAPEYQTGALPVPATMPATAPEGTTVAPLLWKDVVTSPALQQVIRNNFV